MFDVIIPTLMKTKIDVFQYSLECLIKSPIINKIIIIDNTDNSKFFDTFKNLINEKFIIVDNNENLYVNPAWNFGIQLCTSEFYLLLNDDILCSSIVLDQMQHVFDASDIGIVTVKTDDNISINEYKKIIKGYIGKDIQITEKIPNGRIGHFIAGRVNQWIDIPKKLKIFYGDDFIYEQNKIKNMKAVMLLSCLLSHFQSMTCKTVSNSIFIEEGKIYAKTKEVL